MPSLLDYARQLLGFSAYAPPDKGYGAQLDDPSVERVRSSLGGNIQPLPVTKIRWYWADVESAVHAADGGDLLPAAQLYRAMRQDAVFAGLLAQRCGGVVALPRHFFGDQAIIEILESRNGTRSAFDEMCPPGELQLLAEDGLMMGVSVAELVPVQGRDYPVLVRLDPEFLTYRWVESRWYYRSVAGLLPITPGDGRWVLHVPSSRLQPWQSGLWSACGRSFVTKTHAILNRNNYAGKLANPARIAKAPLGATENFRRGMLANLIAWGVNSVFELPAGWDVSLLESKGQGQEVFKDEIEAADRDYMIAIAGQVVTTTGGSGFISGDLFKSVRSDLIKMTADSLAYTIGTQIIPQFSLAHGGVAALQESPMLSWDTAPAKDRKVEAQSLVSAADALIALGPVLAGYQRGIDVDQFVEQFGVPVLRRPLSADEQQKILDAAKDAATAEKVETETAPTGRTETRQ